MLISYGNLQNDFLLMVRRSTFSHSHWTVACHLLIFRRAADWAGTPPSRRAPSAAHLGRSLPLFLFLLQDYGFVLPNNPFDTVQLRFDRGLVEVRGSWPLPPRSGWPQTACDRSNQP